MKRTIVLLIVVIIMMTETTQASWRGGNATRSRSSSSWRGESKEYRVGPIKVRVHQNRGPVYRPYQNRRSYRYQPQQNVVHDAKTGITTSERPSLFGKSKLGEQNLAISRKARETPPPTLQDLEEIAERTKKMGAEKQRKALEKNQEIPIEELPPKERKALLEASIEILKLELQKELEEAKE